MSELSCIVGVLTWFGNDAQPSALGANHGGARRSARHRAKQIMSAGPDIFTLYREFTDALTEVLAETAGNPARRGRLARARAVVKRHAEYSEHEYFLAVEAAFAQWEAMQNVGR